MTAFDNNLLVFVYHGTDDSNVGVFRQGSRQPGQAECVVLARQLVDSIENDHHLVLVSRHQYKVHPAAKNKTIYRLSHL